MSTTSDRNDPRLTRGVDEQPVPMAEAYLVLTDAERAKGFIRPVRRAYVHVQERGGCGAVTTMAGPALLRRHVLRPLRDASPGVGLGDREAPVGPDGEFDWAPGVRRGRHLRRVPAGGVMTAWTATPQQVQRVIAAVLPHASDDIYLPAINCVQIELDGHSFRAVATDRYSVGICRGDLAEWDEDAKKVKKTVACLRPADLRRLFAFLRPNKSTPARWTLTDETLTVAITAGDSLTLRTVQDIGFPNWRGILEEHAKVEARPGAHMGFTAGVVESFNKSAKVLGEYGLGWHFTSPLKPVLIQIGPDFLGLIMPRRVTDDPELDLGHFGVERKAVAA